MRVGFGYDVHRLVEGRPLVLGGVTIPFEKGLAGHSDADVLLHAISDALLGAAALGDIGTHFPDTDPTFEGANSASLLENVHQMLEQRGFTVINIDATIAAEAPRMQGFIRQMRSVIAGVLSIEIGEVSVKATTTERLGFVGIGEGIAAYAVCLIQKAKTGA